MAAPPATGSGDYTLFVRRAEFSVEARWFYRCLAEIAEDALHKPPNIRFYGQLMMVPREVAEDPKVIARLMMAGVDNGPVLAPTRPHDETAALHLSL